MKLLEFCLDIFEFILCHLFCLRLIFNILKQTLLVCYEILYLATWDSLLHLVPPIHDSLPMLFPLCINGPFEMPAVVEWTVDGVLVETMKFFACFFVFPPQRTIYVFHLGHLLLIFQFLKLERICEVYWNLILYSRSLEKSSYLLSYLLLSLRCCYSLSFSFLCLLFVIAPHSEDYSKVFPKTSAKVIFKNLNEICRVGIPAYFITVHNKEKKADVTYFISDTFNHLFDEFSIVFRVVTKPWSVNNGKFFLGVSPDVVSHERCFVGA